MPELASAGYKVRATGRNLKLLEKRGWQDLDNVSIHHLDLNDAANLPALLEGVDSVFFLVHGMNHGHDFIDIELQAAQNFSDALKGSSVERVIYLGALQPSDGEPLITFKPARQPVKFCGKAENRLPNYGLVSLLARDLPPSK